MKAFITSIFVLVFRLSVFAGSTPAQYLPDSIINKIDSLFAVYENNYSPGYAVGIVMGDSLVYAKGYGMANLEYGIPITPETIFHMASVSKQFTAYCLVLLANQGKLKLEDDVRKYLLWFPNMQSKITIYNILNHTSGIRDQWQLLAIAGTRLEDLITQEHIIKMLNEQRTLNFKPGEQYSYSNSGYTMAAEIIGTVTKHTLRQYSDSVIFRPLGMHNTFFHDDYQEIIRNRSYSYSNLGNNNYINSILNYANVGATSLCSNVIDMSKWIMNFYDPRAGNQRDIDLLTRRSKLNDSTELNYGMGIELMPYKGWRQYSHSGADAGYRANISVFPDLKMGFIVLSNVADSDPTGKTLAIADMFISDTTLKKRSLKQEPLDSTKAILKDTLSIRKFLGNYMSEAGLPVSLKLKDKMLYYHLYDDSKLLVRDSSNTFLIYETPDIRFVLGMQQADTTIDILSLNTYSHLTKYNLNRKLDNKFLKLYTGSYYSHELDTRYNIVLKDSQLWLTHSKYNRTRLFLINDDQLINDFWWMRNLRVLRNDKGIITGFEVNCGRVNHLQFLKMDPTGSGLQKKLKQRQKVLL
jgi:CubicO group peptidase (beta-lactamase class C family)